MSIREALFARMPQLTTMYTTADVAPDRYQQDVRPQAGSPYELFVVGPQARIRATGMSCRGDVPVPFPNPKEMTEQGDPEATITVARGAMESVEGTSTQTCGLTSTGCSQVPSERRFCTPPMISTVTSPIRSFR